MASYRATGRHDLAGQIFNRLVADRKFLAAYYTSIPAATLLAGLALDPNRWKDVDWSDIEQIRSFVVCDPACGTGTLLMAAYQQIVQNHREAASGSNPSSIAGLHRALVEDSIHGADVVDAAIHLTASTLAAMATNVEFKKMNVHVFPLDNDEKEGARVGTLEWLQRQNTWAMFSGATHSLTPTGEVVSKSIPRPRSDLSILNPPFRRHNSGTGEGKANTRVFGHKGSDEGSLAKRMSDLLKGTPGNQIAGLASAFLVLADRITKEQGRIAFVLPATCQSGTSWRQVRKLLSQKYHVEYVISSHDPNAPSMSYDTSIAEILLVASKLPRKSPELGRGRFVNLWRRPNTQTEAVALARAIRRAPVHLQSIDEPPVGGYDLMLGNDKWGEIVEAPLGEAQWIGSRWKHAKVAQYAISLLKGQLWDADGTSVVASLSIRSLSSIAGISPYHLQIKGTSGAFDISKGWDSSVQHPSLWHCSAKIHRGIINDPDARLSPKPRTNHQELWSQSGYLHITPDVGYGSQRIHAATTRIPTLGVRSWHTLQVLDDDETKRQNRELALALWLNSTFGMLCHANHSNRSQAGRGLGSRTMLTTLPTLDVRQLDDWQLAAAEEVFRELREVQFEPFYRLNVDRNRIRLDERLVREVLGLDEDALEAVARIRSLLASEPSIHGNKQPASGHRLG